MGTILCIDSDNFDQWLLKEHVERFDIAQEVVQCKSGTSGLRFLEMSEEVPDLVLLDIRLQDMSCYQFLDLLKKLPEEKQQRLRILILSSFVGLEIESLLQVIPNFSSIIGVTVKPFTQHTLQFIPPAEYPGGLTKVA